MTAMPWFRMYSEILDDRKLKRICKKTGHSKALVIGTWTCLLALANNATPRGELSISEDIPYTIDDLEDELGLPSEIISQLIDEFKAMDMMNGKSTLEITNWEKRQFKSDNSTERVRRFREKEAEEAKRYDETLQKRYRIDTDKDTDKIRVEEDIDKQPPPSDSEKVRRAVGQMWGSGDEPQMVDDLIDDFGFDKVMEISGWCNKQKMRSMRQAIKSIRTAAPGWKTNSKESTMEMLDRQLEELGGLDYGK